MYVCIYVYICYNIIQHIMYTYIYTHTRPFASCWSYRNPGVWNHGFVKHVYDITTRAPRRIYNIRADAYCMNNDNHVDIVHLVRIINVYCKHEDRAVHMLHFFTPRNKL